MKFKFDQPSFFDKNNPPHYSCSICVQTENGHRLFIYANGDPRTAEYVTLTFNSFYYSNAPKEQKQEYHWTQGKGWTNHIASEEYMFNPPSAWKEEYWKIVDKAWDFLINTNTHFDTKDL